MPASYPSSAKTFTTKSDGAGNTILAAHINDLQLEVTAIEQDLIAGLPITRGGTGLTGALAANRVPYSNGSAFTSSASLTFDGSTFTTAAIVGTTITPSGLIDASGAAAGQLKFPASQNASSNANTLDDYEEGTWTPVLGGSGGTSGQTYSAQLGHYVKVGQLVVANFDLTLSNKGTITNNLQIQGLPFTALNSGGLFGSTIGLFTNLASALGVMKLVVDGNATTATIYGGTGDVTSLSNLTTAFVDNTTRLVGTAMYRASA